MQEKSYNLDSEKKFFDEHHTLLNEEQRNAFDTIIEKCNMKSPGIVFIDAPGGTGKTFLLNLILSNERSKGKIALAAASSGEFFVKTFSQNIDFKKKLKFRCCIYIIKKW